MERLYKRRCGGVLVLDTDAKTSAHSLPACGEYLALCREDGAKCDGLKRLDTVTHKLKPLPRLD